jgi:phosphatidylinositol-3-phosphatase
MTGHSALANPPGQPPGQQALPPGAIQHVMVIDLENESYDATYGDPNSYLNKVLVPQGELLKNYYATGHVSMDNYIAQVSGQAPNFVTSSDCASATGGAYNDVLPGTLDANQQKYPGQVDGQGCVYPSTVKTIGDQLDAVNHSNGQITWRQYAEDMGNDPLRDGGTTDPLGGTDCAHPKQTNGVGVDNTNNATATDQYATRHNPFVYFHSITDTASRCNSHVVPLGSVKVGSNGAPDTFSGHLAQDLQSVATTPQFSFVTPNLCNDGHDPTPPATGCTGTNTEGTHAGGLTGMNIWLSHWMPLIMNSAAYRSGHLLVVITADEGGITDFAAGDNEQPGPGNANPGYSPLLNTPIPAFGGATYYQLLHVTGLTPNVPPPAGTMPGGGHIGALLLNPKYVPVGIVNTTGSYNHYSALRTYEDLLGITTGGADGRGHLGFAATATPFGSDVFVLPNH